MNPWIPIIRMARKSLIALGLIAFLCVTTIVGLSYLTAEAQSSLAILHGAEQEQQAQVASKKEDLLNMRTHIENYQKLQAQGFIGAGERTNWVEELQNSYNRAGLAGSLKYRLQTPSIWDPSGAAQPPAGTTSMNPPTSTDSMIHELEFEMRDVHELQVLGLVQDFRAHVKGRFRVKSCTMQDAKQTGLTVQCVLQFLTAPASPAPQ